MQKLTKIVATIGPGSESETIIESLLLSGVNVFRFNMKHHDIAWHTNHIALVNTIAKKLDKSVAILIDLQGPEVRIIMGTESIDLQEGEKVLLDQETLSQEFVTKMQSDGMKGFSVSHPDIIAYLPAGQKVVADDGKFSFIVEHQDKKIFLVSQNAGTLKTRKTMNIPGVDFPLPVLVQRDLEALEMATSVDADFVALSFVRSVEDIRFVQKEMQQRQLKAKIIAKIETQRALDSLEEIIEECDGIMVARGDLAVEAAIEQVPFYQKNIIKKCIEKGKFVITATQMLLSMAANPFPTRAEVSDVANAVYDQTDAVMLSEETAMGKYPLATVQMMSKILSFHDYAFTHPTFMPKPEFNQIDQDIASQICDAAYDLYLEYSKSQQDFGGFVVFTQTGKTAQLLSRYRPQAPIFVFTPNAKNCEMLAPNFGIIAFKHPVEHGQEVTRKEVKNIAQLLLEKQLVQKNQKVIILHGDYWGVEGGTSTVRVVQI